MQSIGAGVADDSAGKSKINSKFMKTCTNKFIQAYTSRFKGGID
jgi:hypothetical protein